MRFRDRRDAGRQLAGMLGLMNLAQPVVIGLARGGVPVAKEVADRLGAPLDVMVVRKIGAPGNPELAVGAIADVRLYLNERLINELRVSQAYLRRVFGEQLAELRRRVEVYRGGRAATDVQGRTVILVDDGLATGASARAAIGAIRERNPASVILAVPVSALQTAAELRPLVDQLVAVEGPADLGAVGMWYDDFTPTSDEEVMQCLGRGTNRRQPGRVA